MIKLLQEDSIKWINCPSSAEMERTFKEGEADNLNLKKQIADKIIRLKMNYLLNRVDTKLQENTRDILESPEYSEDLEIKLDEVINVAMDIIDADKIKGNTPIVIVDEEVDIAFWVKDTTIKTDIAIITKESLEIITFDFNIDKLKLKSKLQEAELMALGMVNDYICLYDVKTINYTCVDIESGELYLDSIKISDLLNRGDVISIAAKKAFGDSYEALGGDYCELCRGKNLCIVNNSDNMKLLNTETFEAILLEENDILKILEQGDRFKKWIDEICKYALDEAVNKNKKWQGFKVVEGRVTRKYKDENEVKERLVQAGYDEDKLYSTSLLSLSAMEKLVGKNRLSEILGDLIIKPKGKVALVSVEDKRPEVPMARER